MTNKIKLKRGSGSDPGTSDLVLGEIAIRTDLGKIFLKKDNGSLAEFDSSGGVPDGDKGEITVSNTGDTWAIDDNVIDEANLKISNSPTNGYFLQAQSGNTGGLTWAEVDLTNVNASSLTSGTVPTARLGSGTASSSNFLRGDNSWQAIDLTTLSASSLTSGTIAAARLDTATTQSAGNNSTKIATTAYADTAISNLVDSSPSALNTLNELAAALGDDANFSTTVTNSIATKLPLAGGTLDGDVRFNGANSSNYLFWDKSEDALTLVNGTITATTFSGSGASLTSLNASNISSGTIAAVLVPTLNQNTTGSAGSCTGNAATSTALATARTIAGVSFDGTANISLNNNAITNGAGYITSSGTAAACSGNAATADHADVSDAVDVSGVTTNADLQITFSTGGAGAGKYVAVDSTSSKFTYNPSSNTLKVDNITASLTGNASGSSGSCTGNAATATALATARTIAGVSFDGSANISLNNNAITNGAGYITSADGGNATTLDGYDSTTAATVNTVAVRDSGGQLYCTYLNSTSGDRSSTKPTRFHASDDTFLRYYDGNYMRMWLGQSYKTANYARKDSTTDASYWVGAATYGTVALNDCFGKGNVFWDTWSNPSGQPSGTSHWTGFNCLHYTNRGNDGTSNGGAYGWQMTMGAGNASLLYVRGEWTSNNLGTPTWYKVWNEANDGSGSGLDSDLLDGQHGSYYSNYNNLSNKPTVPTNNNQLSNGAGYITSVSGQNYNSLSNKPTIPTNNNQLSNGAGYVTSAGMGSQYIDVYGSGGTADKHTAKNWATGSTSISNNTLFVVRWRWQYSYWHGNGSSTAQIDVQSVWLKNSSGNIYWVGGETGGTPPDYTNSTDFYN